MLQSLYRTEIVNSQSVSAKTPFRFPPLPETQAAALQKSESLTVESKYVSV